VATNASLDRRRLRRTPVARPHPFAGLAVASVRLGAWQSAPLGVASRPGRGIRPNRTTPPAAASIGLGLSVAALAVLAGRPQAAHLTAGLDGAGRS
jgi:hypothetical protein